MRLRKSDLEVEVLYNRITRGDLDLQPNYQRGEVWDTIRRQRLVDTILRGWYIPAIHVVRDDSGAESILDGQQRLRTIQAFMNNEFRISAKIEPTNEDLANYDGCFFKDLPESARKRFQRFEISVVTLTDYEPAEPSELFFRLNQQYALTPPEKRNALFGRARDQIKEVVATLVEGGLLRREVIGFSNGRLAYDDVMARVCVALQEATLRRQLSNSYIEQFYRTSDFDPATIQRACDAGIALASTLKGRKLMRFNKATLFTWIIFTEYVQRTTGNTLSEEFVRSFEALRSGTTELELPGTAFGNYIDPDLIGVAKVYGDRSSYRVLDISSVLVRDFALHVLHSSSEGGYRRDLAGVIDNLKTASDVEHEMLVEIDRLGWGNEL